ncbi:heat shock 70 kDa protein 15-like protein [Tanacetum coccineum]
MHHDHDTYSHLSVARFQVLNECSEAENWLTKTQQVQDALPKHVEPDLLSADIRKKAEVIDRVCIPILSKPKPAPPKPATLENSDDSEDDDINPDAPEVEDDGGGDRDGYGDESSSDESNFSSAPEDLGAVANNDLLLELPSDD